MLVMNARNATDCTVQERALPAAVHVQSSTTIVHIRSCTGFMELSGQNVPLDFDLDVLNHQIEYKMIGGCQPPSLRLGLLSDADAHRVYSTDAKPPREIARTVPRVDLQVAP